jgi:4-amino-4-deoxy-L-arabinose transferase-like glycosyltransferase
MSLWLPASALLILAVALAFVASSLFLARRQQWQFSILAVALAALLIRGYAAADRALHPWDERYHALVAKNFIETPLTPRLYRTPVLSYDYRVWTSNYIWMHKPPLALWLQAASMKTFGVNEFALRLPSVLASTAASVVTFFIGAVLFTPGVGLLAALFQTFNGFQVDLASGRRVSDHVDTLLIFLFELGILVALKATRRNSAATGLLLGAACGVAYLTKSLPALLLMPVWAAMRLQTVRWPSVAKELGVAAIVAAAIAAPWTIYTGLAFPLESSYEGSFAFRRITEVLEDHGGPPWWYLADMPRFFGELIYVPLAIAIWSALRNRSSREERSLLLWAAIPYVAFSACATKAPGYVMVAAPAIFLLEAVVWLSLWHKRQFHGQGALRTLLTLLLFLLAVLPARQLLEPTGPLEARERHPQWVRDLRQLNRTIGAEPAIVFNLPSSIEAMFYTPYVVYPHLPSAAEVRTLQERGYRVYVFDGGSAPLPELPDDVIVIKPK